MNKFTLRAIRNVKAMPVSYANNVKYRESREGT